MFSRTVVVSLAGEEVGRYRVHHLGSQSHGRRTPPQDADFIAEGLMLFRMRGASREDEARAEFVVLDED